MTVDIQVPALDYYDSLPIVYEFNDFLALMMLCRFYTFFRVLLNTTSYSNTRAHRICRMYGCDSGYFYAAKCLMDEVPLLTVLTLFAFSVMVGG